MTELGFFSDTRLQAFVASILPKVSAFVETGTEEGHTTQWAARRHRYVFSCDVDDSHFGRLRLELPPGVVLRKENSPDFILDIGPLVGDFPLFFLDAHWLDYWPLLDELRMIVGYYGKAVIIVHDCAVPGRSNFWACRGGGADHDGPVCNWEYIKKALNGKAKYRLYYPTYGAETPGYAVIFMNCEPMGDLKDLAECRI